eukprot:TRINITY_DN2302_c0_g1_i3.p1 TRINITY_DN2302_c0_g1~~TRINITY_DN2302_c0_g1_i3.p1  ORF type:complete len:787 (-),score=11.75 TRINITY_DN2302_c0_g1_i3:89-2449(-)
MEVEKFAYMLVPHPIAPPSRAVYLSGDAQCELERLEGLISTPNVSEVTAYYATCPAWFCARRGTITGTTARALIRACIRRSPRQCAAEHWMHVIEVLNMANPLNPQSADNVAEQEVDEPPADSEMESAGGTPSSSGPARTLFPRPVASTPMASVMSPSFSRRINNMSVPQLKEQVEMFMKTWPNLAIDRRAQTKTSIIAKLNSAVRQLSNMSSDEESVVQTVTLDLLKQLIMKPIGKNTQAGDAMSEGLRNEIPLAEQLPAFLKANCAYVVLVVMQVGLLVRTENGGLLFAVTPDFLAAIRFGGQVEDSAVVAAATVEMKTSVSPAEIGKIVALANAYGAVVEIDLRDECGDRQSQLQRFHKLVPGDHRLQLLQQLYVAVLNLAIYVRGTKDRIVYVVILHVPDKLLTDYGTVLCDAADIGAPWLNGQADPVQLSEEQLASAPYLVDNQTIRTVVKLSRCILSNATGPTSRPLKKAKYIRESAVALWNNVKGGVDVTSRYLANVQPQVKVSGQSFIAIRMLYISLLNLYHSWRLVKYIPCSQSMEKHSYAAAKRTMERSMADTQGFKVFLRNLLLTLNFDSIYNPHRTGRKRSTAEIEGTLEYQLAKRGKKESALSDEMAKVRLCSLKPHLVCKWNEVSKATTTTECIVCKLAGYSVQVRSGCVRCKAGLCRRNIRKCFELWHGYNDLQAAFSLPQYCQEYKKRGSQESNNAASGDFNVEAQDHDSVRPSSTTSCCHRSIATVKVVAICFCERPHDATMCVCPRPIPSLLAFSVFGYSLYKTPFSS